MEPNLLFKIAYGIGGTLIGNILFGSGSLDQSHAKKAGHHLTPRVVIEHRETLNVPSFVTSVPRGHLAGVSSPMPSLAKARKSAVDDVVRQILGSIGVEYDHRYVDRISGTVHNSQRTIDDSLIVNAHGVVLDVERNIVKSSWYLDVAGRYVSFILVRYPDELIKEMRRLSKGPKVIAKVVSQNRDGVRLKVSEVHGVSVVISSADVTVRKRNRFAKAISFCIWHVPRGSVGTYQFALDPVRVCNGSAFVCLSLDKSKKDFSDYLLGARLTRSIVLHGHDELGRAVSAKMVF